MSPLEISILLHYKGGANDYRDGDFSAPAVQITVNWFAVEAGMLEVANSFNPIYKLTDKGRFFVDQLCAMPLPINKWVMPSVEINNS